MADYNTGIPMPGFRSVRIEKAEKTKSKSGNDMLKIRLAVSKGGGVAYKKHVYHYIVEGTKFYGHALKDFYDAFGIPGDNDNPYLWRGAVGVAKIEREPYNGQLTAKVKKLVPRDKANDRLAEQKLADEAQKIAAEQGVVLYGQDVLNSVPF
ncbi:hypothetical protein FACS1894167_12190 [Synergistales bacterium]|nr:hypothetical protein FACS1894167_12190 [Synergistales bacterium]